MAKRYLIGRAVKRSGGWWITDQPAGWDDHGPYATKTDCDDDREGLGRQWKANRRYWENLTPLVAEAASDVACGPEDHYS